MHLISGTERVHREENTAAETLQPLWKRMGCQGADQSECTSEDTGPEGHVKELEHPSKPREGIEVF